MWHCGIIMQMRGEFLGNGYMLLLMMLLLRTLKLSCAMAGRRQEDALSLSTAAVPIST